MYELMVIAKIDSSDEVFGKVEKFLKDIDAVSVKTEKLGKKLLAYPIAKQTEADYFLYNFDTKTQSLKALSDKLRLEQEDILRHMLIKVAKVSKASRSKKVLKESTEEKEEEVREKPKVTVTTRTKVSTVDTKALADKRVSQVTKVKTDVASKREKKTVKSKKKLKVES